MDNTFLIYGEMALFGIIYFMLYRLIAFKVLKWKMIHAIWLPLIYAVGFTGFGLSLLSTPWFGANRTLLSIIGVLVELNFPVLVFFIIFGLFTMIDKENKVKK